MPGVLDKLIPSELVSQIVAAVDKHLPAPIDQMKKLELESAIEQALISAQAAQNQAQAEINKTEAASPRLFVAGWRPALGWVGAYSLGAYFAVRITIATVLWTIITIRTGQFPSFPVDIGELLTLIGGMLGLGGLRTYEKKQGVQDKH